MVSHVVSCIFSDVFSCLRIFIIPHVSPCVIMFGISYGSSCFIFLMVSHVCCLLLMFGVISHGVSCIIMFSHGPRVLQTCHP